MPTWRDGEGRVGCTEGGAKASASFSRRYCSPTSWLLLLLASISPSPSATSSSGLPSVFALPDAVSPLSCLLSRLSGNLPFPYPCRSRKALVKRSVPPFPNTKATLPLNPSQRSGIIALRFKCTHREYDLAFRQRLQVFACLSDGDGKSAVPSAPELPIQSSDAPTFPLEDPARCREETERPVSTHSFSIH